MDGQIIVYFNVKSGSLGCWSVCRGWTIRQVKDFISTNLPTEIPADHILLRVTTWDLDDDNTVEFYIQNRRIYPCQGVQVVKLHPESSCEVCRNLFSCSTIREPEVVKDRYRPSLKAVAERIKKIARDFKNRTNPKAP